MKKRLLALLVMMVIIFSFTGCQGGSNEGEPVNDPVKDNSEGTVSEDVQTSPVIWVVRGVNNVENLSDNKLVYEKVKEESGIDFELLIVPADNWSDKINLMVATDEEFDILNITEDAGNWSKYYQKGALQPIDEYLQYIPNLMKRLDDESLKACKDSTGAIYALPRQEIFYKQCTPAIRQDWLDALGMECPTTLAELENYFAAILENDLNGNGVQDEIPCLPFAGTENTNFRAYFMGFHGDRYIDDEGNVMPWYMHENAFLLMNKLHEWYDKGYIFSGYLTASIQQGFDLITADRIGMWTGPYNAGVRASNSLVISNPDATISWVALDNLTDYPEGGSSYWGSNPAHMAELVLSANSKNAKWAFKLLDWMFDDVDNYMLCAYGIEGTHWEYTNDSKSEYVLLPNSNEKYVAFYLLNEWYDYTVFPAPYIDPENYIDVTTNELRNKINKMQTIESFDYFVPYDFTGTEAEMLSDDAASLIDETCSRIVLGEYGEAQWKDAVNTAWEIDGKIRSAVWTQQYHAFVGE